MRLEMRKTNPLLAILLLLFWQDQFAKRAVQHDYELKLPDSPKNAYDRVRESARLVRSAFFSALCITVIAIILGIFSGYCLKTHIGTPSSNTTSALQIVGAAIILVATLAKGGWNIQTHSGETLLEKTDRWIFVGLYFFGTFLFVLSLGWGY